VPSSTWTEGATTSFPSGYVGTRQWAARYPRTGRLDGPEQSQQLADVSRAAVEQAMVAMPARSRVREHRPVMALDSYPVSTGPAGSVE